MRKRVPATLGVYLEHKEINQRMCRPCSPALIRWPGGTAGSCREHIGTPDVESAAIRAILSMVDFNCFQMMMVTRNAELEMEQSGGSGGGGEYGGEDEDDEETQLRRAIELSMAEAGGGGEPADAGDGAAVAEAVAAVETEVEVVAVRLTNMQT